MAEGSFIEIHWTSGSIDEARRVCRYLVQERYVACAQIIPWIESIYMWNNQLETGQESKVVMKTRHGNFDAIKELIKKNSTYEVPEIIYVTINGGNTEYLDWVAEMTQEFAGTVRVKE
ncbi:MAG: divalent-cation tolerance protein CutA [Chlamydiales bacterium]|nr:divalent-cation tolerance protein CutA [Chlamydiia bacterium]MCP5507264.1 divalent-cation tolerance protein CutA [Chlamydiales bacterium]